jgi:hypothetical protein
VVRPPAVARLGQIVGRGHPVSMPDGWARRALETTACRANARLRRARRDVRSGTGPCGLGGERSGGS